MTGALATRRTAQKVSSEACETSTSIPMRCISRTTSSPNGDRPWCLASTGPANPEESAQSFVFVCVRVMYRQPRRCSMRSVRNEFSMA